MKTLGLPDGADADELMDALLKAGRDDRPPSGGADRALLMIGVALPTGAASAGLTAAPAVSASGGSAGSPAIWTLAIKWGVVGGLAGAVLMTGVDRLATSSTDARATVASVARHEGPQVPSGPVARDEPAGEPAQSAPLPAPPSSNEGTRADEPSDRPEVPPASDVPRKAPPARHAPVAADALPPERGRDVNGWGAPTAVLPTGLGAEVALLDEAHAALAGGAAARALEALDHYRARFPAGHLFVEASAVRVEALAKARRRHEAIGLARVFLAQFGQTPLAVRVRAIAAELQNEDESDKTAP